MKNIGFVLANAVANAVILIAGAVALEFIDPPTIKGSNLAALWVAFTIRDAGHVYGLNMTMFGGKQP